jgi:hypothetical protein
MNITYERDKEGDYHLRIPNDSVTIGLTLPTSSEIRIVCIYNDPIPDTKWMKALLACNEFHKQSKFGHAYFVPKSDTQGVFVYELWLDFENGMVSTEYLIRRAIVRAIALAGELFTKIAQECGTEERL